MKATEDLIHEHAAVLVALKILDKVAAAVAASEEQAPVHLGAAAFDDESGAYLPEVAESDV